MQQSGLVAVDVDPRNGGELGLEQIEAEHGKLCTDVEAWSGGGGSHYLFQLPHNCGPLPGKLGKGVDLKANGYLMVEPSNHMSGDTYEWADECSPLEGHIPGPLPDWIRDLARQPIKDNTSSGRERFIDSGQVEELASALTALDADDRDTWIRVGMCLRECGEAGYRLWNEWSKTSPKYKAGECRKKWMRDIKPGKGLSFESVFKMAQEGGWKNPLGSKAKKVEDDDYDFGVILSQIQDAREVVIQDGDIENLGGLGVIRADCIAPSRVKWLWPGYLARGKINILAGDPGCGKTMIACAIEAAVTTGHQFPTGDACSPGRVLMFTSEDDLSDTIIPRLLAAGADMSRVRFIMSAFDDKGQMHKFDPQTNLGSVVKMFQEEPFDLLVLDSLSDFVTGDSNKNEDVRNSLDKLKDITERCGFALLGIMHQSKGSAGQKLQNRVIGSVGFVGKARLLMNACKGAPGESSVLAVSKANNTSTDKGFFYTMEDGHFEYDGEDWTEKRIAWGDMIDGSAQEVIDATEGITQPRRGPKTEKGQDCKGFILGFLENGPAQWDSIVDEFAPTGVSQKTMERARDELRKDGAIISGKCKTDNRHYWYIEGNECGVEFYAKK
jgi:putative DNA primase/helicase